MKLKSLFCMTAQLLAQIVSTQTMEDGCVGLGPFYGNSEGEYYQSDFQFVSQLKSDIENLWLTFERDRLPNAITMDLHARFFMSNQEQSD